MFFHKVSQEQRIIHQHNTHILVIQIVLKDHKSQYLHTATIIMVYIFNYRKTKSNLIYTLLKLQN